MSNINTFQLNSRYASIPFSDIVAGDQAAQYFKELCFAADGLPGIIERLRLATSPDVEYRVPRFLDTTVTDGFTDPGADSYHDKMDDVRTKLIEIKVLLNAILDEADPAILAPSAYESM